ncbi:MAG: hypothetical protein OK455_09895 [Thaumarchaeota archaeon]|nr:hypothetical protein [Nitrososphaerota archaeon]
MAEAEIISVLSKNTRLENLTFPAALTGKSGVKHTFSFSFGEGEKPEIVCDVIVGTIEQDETRVLSLFIKVFDVGPKQAILCVSPGLTKEASRLAMLYNIVTLESADPKKLPQMIEGVLKRLGDGGKGKHSARPPTD